MVELVFPCVLGVVSETRSTLYFRTFGHSSNLSLVLSCIISSDQHRWGEVDRSSLLLFCLSSSTCVEPTLCVGAFVYSYLSAN